MRKILLSPLFLAVLVLFSGCGSQKTTAQVIVVKDKIEVSQQRVAQDLKYLSSDELKGRKTGTTGIEKAAKYIEEVFRESGIEPYFETYRDSFQVQGLTGYNIVGYKEGSDPELKDQFIIIGAHYDHIGYGKKVGNDSIANGANDNASGTTAVLELARYFSEVETARSILFTLYSAEEMGLVGSRELAEELKEEGLDLYVMFNIEMVGVPMENKDYTAYLTGYKLSNLAEKFNAYSGEKVLGFLPQAKEYRLFMRSDNYPFYEIFQVPAQTISTFDFTNYDYYHHVDDEFGNLSTTHLTNLIKAIIPGITEMANTPGKEIKMTGK